MRTDDTVPSASHDGETYYFCAETCRRAFEDEPAAFADVDPHIGEGTHAH